MNVEGTQLAEEALGISNAPAFSTSSVLNAVHHDAIPVHPPTGYGDPRQRPA
jgi:hypothetical protein